MPSVVVAFNTSSPLGLENISDYSMVSWNCYVFHTFFFTKYITITFTILFFRFVVGAHTHDLTPPLSSTSRLWTGVRWLRKSAWDLAVPWWANPANTSQIWPCCLSSCSSALTPWPSRSRSSSPAVTSPPRLGHCVEHFHMCFPCMSTRPLLYSLVQTVWFFLILIHIVFTSLFPNLLLFFSKCRALIADFSIIISILVFCALDYVLSLDTPKLHVPTQIKVYNVSSWCYTTDMPLMLVIFEWNAAFKSSSCCI